jgi:hypothetical protein
MKKIVAIITLVLYFSLSAIQVISLHFCHGELESLYFTNEKSSCCAATHTDHSACCEDVTIEVDFDTDHLVSESRIILESSEALNILHCIFTPAVIENDQDNLAEVDLADKIPPPKIYLLQHSFLFYG